MIPREDWNRAESKSQRDGERGNIGAAKGAVFIVGVFFWKLAAEGEVHEKLEEAPNAMWWIGGARL